MVHYYYYSTATCVFLPVPISPDLLCHCYSVLFLMTVCMQNHIGANRAVLIRPSVTTMGNGCYGWGGRKESGGQ